MMDYYIEKERTTTNTRTKVGKSHRRNAAFVIMSAVPEKVDTTGCRT